MMEWSWTELQALCVRAASGSGVPAAQSLAFGAMVPRHLADGGSEGPIGAVLDQPDLIVRLAHQIESMIETASMSTDTVSKTEADGGLRALMISWLASLPCQADVAVSGQDVRATLSLSAPSTRSRPARISISEGLVERLRSLAARTYVPDSAESRAVGAGAGLMDLD